MKKIGILYHPRKESALPFAESIEKHLDASGVKVWKCSAWEIARARALVEGTELVLTIGGDGRMCSNVSEKNHRTSHPSYKSTHPETAKILAMRLVVEYLLRLWPNTTSGSGPSLDISYRTWSI